MKKLKENTFHIEDVNAIFMKEVNLVQSMKLTKHILEILIALHHVFLKGK